MYYAYSDFIKIKSWTAESKKKKENTFLTINNF